MNTYTYIMEIHINIMHFPPDSWKKIPLVKREGGREGGRKRNKEYK
jgi:hypothetical protein